MTGAPDPPRDTFLGKVFWRAFIRAAGVLGLRYRRAAIAGLMAATSGSDDGYRKNVYRVVSPHRRHRAPEMVTVPQSWWTDAPIVTVSRLGLELELDLRDNLQRTLFFTGRYEPSVSRVLRDEAREGDVFIDVGAHIGVHTLPWQPTCARWADR